MKNRLKSRKLWGGLVAVLIVIIVIVYVYGTVSAPETSTLVVPTDDVIESTPEATAEATVEAPACLESASGGGCIRLPIFSGENLSGDVLTFPDAFETEYIITVILFDREQQERAADWLPVIEELAEARENLSFYDIPVFPEIPPIARTAARLGLRVQLDEHLHDLLVMVFLEDLNAFLEAMEIPDVENIQVYIMTDEGVALWHVEGDYTEEKAEALREQVALLVGAAND